MKLSFISKYRTHLMGVAMIWIMWFHSPFYGQSDRFHFIHNIGFFGVDMFLLVSGLGLYFSMRKSKSIGEFYKKRALRILPAYLIVVCFFYLFCRTEVSMGNVVLSALGINYFRGTTTNIREYFDWFLPTLAVFYLLTPLYDKLFQKAKSKWKFTLLCMTVSPLLCIILYQFDKQVLYGSAVRIAVFLLGYWIGWFLYEKQQESKGSWMIYLPLLFLGIWTAYYIQTYIKNPTVFKGLNCYPALLVAPSLCALLSFVFAKYEQLLSFVGGKLNVQKPFEIAGKIVLLPLYICGRYSLEIYLFHQRVMEYMSKTEQGAELCKTLNEDFGIHTYSKEYYFLIALISIVLAVILHELIRVLAKHINKYGLITGIAVLANTVILWDKIPFIKDKIVDGEPVTTLSELTGISYIWLGLILGIAAALIITAVTKKQDAEMPTDDTDNKNGSKKTLAPKTA